jgi:hypothetical protein
MFSLSNFCICLLINILSQAFILPLHIYLPIYSSSYPYHLTKTCPFIFIPSYICLSVHSSKTQDAAVYKDVCWNWELYTVPGVTDTNRHLQRHHIHLWVWGTDGIKMEAPGRSFLETMWLADISVSKGPHFVQSSGLLNP